MEFIKVIRKLLSLFNTSKVTIPLPIPEPDIEGSVQLKEPIQNSIPELLENHYASPDSFAIGEKGLELIKQFEGLKLETYICPAGVPTIGYGTTKIDGKKLTIGMQITKEQAEGYLRNDVKVFENHVQRLVKVPLTQNMFDALVSFTYNLGAGNLGRSTLLKKLNDRDYGGAAEELLRWNKAGGKVLNGLVRRREAEKALFLS